MINLVMTIIRLEVTEWDDHLRVDVVNVGEGGGERRDSGRGVVGK